MDIAGTAAEGVAVVAAEVSRDAEEGKETVGAREFPAIEILTVCGGSESNGIETIVADFRDGDRWAKEGIATEDDKFVLSEKSGRSKGQEYERENSGKESEHEVASKR